MDTYQFITALIAAIPALLTAIAAFWHSVNTKQKLQARVDELERYSLKPPHHDAWS